MGNQLSALDLDAIAVDWSEGNFDNPDDAVRAAQRTIPVLVQRLREAQAEVVRLTALKTPEWRYLDGERERLKARIAELESESMRLTHEITGHLGTIAGLKRNAKDYRALKTERDQLAVSGWIDGKTLADQAHRLRQLERLREAAEQVISDIDNRGNMDSLSDALVAVEKLRLTANPTTHKAGSDV